MKPQAAQLFHICNGAVVLTGLVYAYFRYLAPRPDNPDLGMAVAHPAEDPIRTLHLVAAPALIYVCGILWQTHVSPQLRKREKLRKRSGWTLLLALLPMILSGILLQVAVEEIWRKIYVILHLVTGGLWTLGFAVHYFSPSKSR